MGSGPQEVKLDLNSAAIIVWSGNATVGEVRCAASVLAEIAETAMSGYYRYPWGGVEIGGLLFGKIEAGAVHIYSFREAECEHHYGPAFELSQKDEETFGRLLSTDTEEQRAGLTPVGWYQSVSRRDVSLSDHAMATFQRFFPAPKQIAMVLKRSKNDPLSVGIFRRDARGRIELHSRTQEFTLDTLRHHKRPPVPESSAVEAELPVPVLEQLSVSREQQQPVFELPPTVPHDHGFTEPSFTEDRPQPVFEPTPPETPAPALAQPSFTEEQSQPIIEPSTPKSPPPALAQASAGGEQQQPVLEQPPEPPRPELVEPPFREEQQQPVLGLPPEPPRPTLAHPSFREEQQPVSEPQAAPLAFMPTSLNAPVEDPFCAAPDAEFFFPSTDHREALGILFHQIRSRAGFLALVGAPGTGKTIVLERLMDLLKADATEFAFLINPKITAPEFFELIAHDLELPCAGARKVETVIALNDHLLARSSAGLTTALIVDNAHKLSTEVLEEIELLGNLENRNGRLLQVVFAGKPSFERQLDAPELSGLKQRLLMRARLEPLDAAQTADYIKHRMEKAGRDQSVFPADALAEIYRRTRGVPRLINGLCGRLLQLCRGLQVMTVSMRLVEHAADELGLDGRDEPLRQLREVAHP